MVVFFPFELFISSCIYWDLIRLKRQREDNSDTSVRGAQWREISKLKAFVSGASKSFVLAAIRYAGMRVRLRYTSSADLCHKMTASVGFLYLGIKRLQVLYNDHYSAFAEAPFEISRREQLLLAGRCFDHICTVPDKIDGASERGRLIREKTLNFKRDHGK